MSKDHSDSPQNELTRSPLKSTVEVIIVVTVITFMSVMLVLLSTSIFTAEQMYVIRPLSATVAVYVIFSYILWFRTRVNLFGEIGFIYLSFALAYTVLPAITFLKLNFIFPAGFDGLNFSILSPQPSELSTHSWRHVLFISGVAAGYLVVRGRALPSRPLNQGEVQEYGPVIAVMFAVILSCILAVTLLSAPVATYLGHYTRFDHLTWFLRRMVYLCLIFKSGGYFVILTLMFSQYHKYKRLIFIVVPILCIYETVYSFGSRIETLALLLAVIGFYHYKAAPISIKKGLIYLCALAVLFSVVEQVRTARDDSKPAPSVVATEGIKSASEFGSVYYTGFHLYSERAQGSIPPRDWQMFFYEFLALIPFIDHTSHHPQYWYARHYFPRAAVPPQTMGVIVDSAIWGGEIDLLIRSVVNGALFALLMRWFLRWQTRWWALSVYIYCYATCIMTLKYSVLYQLIPVTKILLPTIILTGILLRLQKAIGRFKAIPVNSSV